MMDNRKISNASSNDLGMLDNAYNNNYENYNFRDTVLNDTRYDDRIGSAQESQVESSGSKIYDKDQE